MEPGIAIIPSQFTKSRVRPVANKTHPVVRMGGSIASQPIEPVIAPQLTEPVAELEPVTDFDTGVLQAPDGRAGLARWTEYALRVGYTRDEIANLSKNEIRELVGSS